MKNDMDTRVTSYIKEEAKLLKKYKIAKKMIINFGRKKKVPWLSKIAIKIINAQGGIVDLQFFNLKK
jgi:hypothetical protein